MRTIPWRTALREARDLASAPQFWVALSLMTVCAGVGYLAGFRDGARSWQFKGYIPGIEERGR